MLTIKAQTVLPPTYPLAALRSPCFGTCVSIASRRLGRDHSGMTRSVSWSPMVCLRDSCTLTSFTGKSVWPHLSLITRLPSPPSVAGESLPGFKRSSGPCARWQPCDQLVPSQGSLLGLF